MDKELTGCSQNACDFYKQPSQNAQALFLKTKKKVKSCRRRSIDVVS